MFQFKIIFNLIFLILFFQFLMGCRSEIEETSQKSSIHQNESLLIPFRDISQNALGEKRFIENRYPGIAIFDFDRDGDLDFYVTSGEINSLIEETRGGNNKLFENLGNEKFSEISDTANVSLSELTSFVLPGGSVINAQFHIARNVCRRAERRVVSLLKKENIDSVNIRYLNRLSDALFVWSRWVSNIIGDKENLWDPNQ